MKSKHWFLPKCYGYGFFPISWQGWLSTLILLGLILLSAYVNNFFNYQVNTQDGFRYFLDVVILCLLFTLLFKDKVKGGLRWQWGRKK